MVADMELINLQAVVSFRYDASGPMLGINEPEPGQSASRLFLGRTTAGNLWHDLPNSLIRDPARLLHAEPAACDLNQSSRSVLLLWRSSDEKRANTSE
jgi:hypothetical protein